MTVCISHNTVKGQKGKKAKESQVSYEREICWYQIKFLICRAYSVAIRLFLHFGQLKKPLIFSDVIGDKQNVRTSNTACCLLIYKLPISAEVYASVCSIYAFK